MIGCQRMHVYVRHHMHLHVLLDNLPMRVFRLPPQISVSYVKVGSPTTLNRWDLSSQHVTLTIHICDSLPFTRWLKVSM